MCAFVRKKNISFDLLAAPVKHYFDDVARFDRRLRIYEGKLRGGNEAFALASDIDNYFLIGNAENSAVQDLAIVGREMATVVVQEGLIVGTVDGSRQLNIIIRGTGHVSFQPQNGDFRSQQATGYSRHEISEDLSLYRIRTTASTC